MAATKCFHHATASSNERYRTIITVPFDGRKEQVKFSRRNTLQVPSLDPRFAIFIDLCSSYFQVVESFTVQVNKNYSVDA